MLKSLLVLGVSALLAVADPFPMQTPAAELAKRDDDIECQIRRFKLETADPPPKTPDVVASIAKETPTFLAFEHFNVTDACEGPKVTGDAGKEISSYVDAMSSWSSKHQCELSSIYADCTGAARYSTQNLEPSFWCTSFQEEAAKATCTAGSGSVEAGMALMGLAALVAAAVAW